MIPIPETVFNGWTERFEDWCARALDDLNHRTESSARRSLGDDHEPKAR
jgi:hypothetical protein